MFSATFGTGMLSLTASEIGGDNIIKQLPSDTLIQRTQVHMYSQFLIYPV